MKRSKQSGDEFVQDRLNESEANRRRDDLLLSPVRDLAEAWCLVKPVDFKTVTLLEETRLMIIETVTECWGSNATVEFEREPKRRVTARHSDGRTLVIGEE